MYSVCLLFLCLHASQPALSGVVKGHVYDRLEGTPLVNATVRLENTPYATLTGLDGSFILNNIPEGGYQLVVDYVSFKIFTRSIKIVSAGVTVAEVQLEPANDNWLEEVVIDGQARGNDDVAVRRLEKSAPQVMNIVSEQSIKISPDLMVANLLQRVSGISIERNKTGEGRYAILRGMDKRYNYTTVNGIKIPSPDKTNRYIPLDIFPSDLLKRLEVYKTLTPVMEGDAIGGVVNMVLKDAPDTLSVSVNVMTGYHELFFDRDFTAFRHRDINYRSPYETHPDRYNATPDDFSKGPVRYRSGLPAPDFQAGFSAGNRYFKKRLGVLLAGSFQNTYKGSNSLFFESNVVDTLKGVTLTTMKERNYSEQELRYAVYSKMDYRLRGRNKIQWNHSFFNLTNFQVREMRSTFLTLGGYDPVNGNASLEYESRSRTTRQFIYNNTLQGRHFFLGNLRLDWSAVYSLANGNQPDDAKVTLNGEERNFNFSKTTAKTGLRRWERHSDRDLSGYLNFSFDQPVASLPVAWTIGALYRDKKRKNFYNEYELRSRDPYAGYGKDFTDYDQISWIVENPRGSIGTSLNYRSFEDIHAEYLQFSHRGRQMEILGGVRLESTIQGYHLNFPIGQSRPDGRQAYTDALPDIHFKYKPGSNTNVRLSYFRAVNRPGFFEIVPYTIVYEDYVERGNPDLKHAVTDNIDIRFERFSNPAEQMMVAVFYKYIQNPVEYILRPDSLRGQDIYYMPGNFGNATNYGTEIDFIKYFRKIGIKINYTYTHSRITTSKSKRIRDGNGDLKTVSVDETRPLYGQPAHIGNLAVLFKDARQGWDAQVAFQYTGERISAVSQFIGNDLWQKSTFQMDASVEKKFRNKLGIFLKSNNLLNTPMMVYLKNDNTRNMDVPAQQWTGKTLIRREYYYRSFYLGVRYSW